MTTNTSKTLNTFLTAAAATLYKYKAEDLTLIDLRSIPNLTDEFLLLATCQSEAQLKSLLNYLKRELTDLKVKPIRLEHSPGSRWGILDSGEVVIHIFEANTREFYSLERLWADAHIQELDPKDFTLEVDEDTYTELDDDEFI
jgi:ribosome-associated protein